MLYLQLDFPSEKLSQWLCIKQPVRQCIFSLRSNMMKALRSPVSALIIALAAKSTFSLPQMSDDKDFWRLDPDYKEGLSAGHQDLPIKNKDDITKLSKLIKEEQGKLEENVQNDQANRRIISLRFEAMKEYLDQMIGDSINNVKKTFAEMNANFNENLRKITKNRSQYH